MQAQNADMDAQIDAQNAICGRIREKNRGAAREMRTELRIKGFYGEIEVLKNTVSFKRSTGCTDYRRYCTVREKDRDIRADGDDARRKNRKSRRRSRFLGRRQPTQLRKATRCRSGRTLAEQINTLKAGVIEKLNDIASLKSRLSSVEAFKESFAQRREAIRLEKEHGRGAGAN